MRNNTIWRVAPAVKAEFGKTGRVLWQIDPRAHFALGAEQADEAWQYASREEERRMGQKAKQCQKMVDQAFDNQRGSYGGFSKDDLHMLRSTLPTLVETINATSAYERASSRVDKIVDKAVADAQKRNKFPLGLERGREVMKEAAEKAWANVVPMLVTVNTRQGPAYIDGQRFLAAVAPMVKRDGLVAIHADTPLDPVVLSVTGYYALLMPIRASEMLEHATCYRYEGLRPRGGE